MRRSFLVCGLATALLLMRQGAWAADEQKPERAKETPRKEAPHREPPAARPQPAPQSTLAPRVTGPAPAPPEHRERIRQAPANPPSTPRPDPLYERRGNTPRDPRNDQHSPTTIDRQERRNNPSANQPPTTMDRQDRRNNPPTSAPPSTRDRQGGLNNGGNSRSVEPSRGFVRGSNGRPETYRSSTGNEARFRPDGRVQAVQGRGVLITHGNGDARRIIATRPDRTVIVTNQSGHGYIQRPYAYRGTEYSQRTYYVKGRVYSSYYRPSVYRGISLNVYVPVRYYTPGFYGYAYRPWARPISYRWGWYDEPWFGYYGGYFSPQPYYASPSLWLVDYIIASRLAESYQDRANAQQAAYNQGGHQSLTPEIRQAIADEVQFQLQAERDQGQAFSQNANPDPARGGLSDWFSDGRPHTFIVSFTLDVTDDRGQGCTVTRGDVLQLTQAPPPDSDVAYVQVVASKGPDCRTGSMVAVSLQDLQDIQNQMRESVNQGLGELHSKAGQNGIPTLPPDARKGPTVAGFAEAAPPPDQGVAEELNQQLLEADKVEQEVLGEAQQEDGTIPRPPGLRTTAPTAPPPAEISLGMTIDQVVAAFGPPVRVANLGTKQVYSYKDVKVTFVNGKVTDVQ